MLPGHSPVGGQRTLTRVATTQVLLDGATSVPNETFEQEEQTPTRARAPTDGLEMYSTFGARNRAASRGRTRTTSSAERAQRERTKSSAEGFEEVMSEDAPMHSHNLIRSLSINLKRKNMMKHAGQKYHKYKEDGVPGVAVALKLMQIFAIDNIRQQFDGEIDRCLL